jgi:hypothetical protein
MASITLSKEGLPRNTLTIEGDNITVADVVALAGSGWSTDGMSVFINAVEGGNESVLQDGDNVSVAREAKGNS